jgi:hypothetical protein
MELIKKEMFYNSETQEYRSEIAIYEDAQFYKVLHESGANINGRIFLNKYDAIDYFNQAKKNICMALSDMGIIYEIR